MASLKIRNSHDSLQGKKKKVNFAERKVKREEFIFTFLKTRDGELSLRVPLAPIMRLMAEASRKEL